MSFDLRTKRVFLKGDEALPCLEAWSQMINETGQGFMIISRNGELIKIKVSKNGDAERLDLELSHIQIGHTYTYASNGGGFKADQCFDLVVEGKDAEGTSLDFSLYANFRSPDGDNWYASLSPLRVNRTPAGENLFSPESPASIASADMDWLIV